MFANPIELFKFLGLLMVICLFLIPLILAFRRVMKSAYHFDLHSLYERYPLLQPLNFKGDVGWRELKFEDKLGSRASKLCEQRTIEIDPYAVINCCDETWYVVTSSDELVSVPIGKQLANYLIGDWKYVVLNRYYNGEDVTREEYSFITVYTKLSG